MKFALAAVACLLALSHGVDGASSLRAQKDKDSERKLNGYGLNNGYGRPSNPYGTYYDPYGFPMNNMTMPTERPTPVPTPRPTPEPTPQPTPYPSRSPSSSPSVSPSTSPSSSPSASPSTSPSSSPSAYPSPSPSAAPSVEPSAAPSPSPSSSPSDEPSASPSVSPSAVPTHTDEPSETPTQTDEPSEVPTITDEPSEDPTISLEPTPAAVSLTVAEVICDEANRDIFLGFCIIIQFTGLDFILNDFEDLTDEYSIIDDIGFLLEGGLGEFGLNNMLPLFFDFEESGTFPPAIIFNEGGGLGRKLEDGNELDLADPSDDLERSLQAIIPNNIEFEAFVEAFLDENYNVQVTGDFDTFVSDFRDSADNDKVFTVFAPNNVAMADLNFRTGGLSLEKRKEILSRFATYHVFVGDNELEYDDLKCPDPDPNVIKMSNGEKSRTECKDQNTLYPKKFQVGLSNTAEFGFPKIKRSLKDTKAANGVIQVIDDVVLEPFKV